MEEEEGMRWGNLCLLPFGFINNVSLRNLVHIWKNQTEENCHHNYYENTYLVSCSLFKISKPFFKKKNTFETGLRFNKPH